MMISGDCKDHRRERMVPKWFMTYFGMCAWERKLHHLFSLHLIKFLKCKKVNISSMAILFFFLGWVGLGVRGLCLIKVGFWLHLLHLHPTNMEKQIGILYLDFPCVFISNFHPRSYIPFLFRSMKKHSKLQQWKHPMCQCETSSHSLFGKNFYKPFLSSTDSTKC